MSELIYRQVHGYRSGHQLLESNIKLDHQDQDLIDRLSDMAGSLRPGEFFNPYLTAYPLPSSKYYALARTVQDLDAPRAGCVITTTLIVTMEHWIKCSNINDLIETLDFLQSHETITVNQQLSIQGAVISELVEAVFLEQRKPIVVFDANNEILISARLLASFWPSKRRTFSVCTYALSPRTIGEKSFDLLFSPKSARVRFSDWDGRRIESNEKEYLERHRWTKPLSDLIFFSESPSLLSIDNLGALNADVNGDESILRLTLMWNDLLKKAEHSPTAVLGLIDIANSQKKLELVSEQLLPKIIQALKIIDGGSIDISNSWAQITALLNKLANTDLKKRIIPYVALTGDLLTKSDWRSALNFLMDQNIEDSDHTLLIEKILDRLALLAPDELMHYLGEFSSFQLLKIITLSEDMRARIFSLSQNLQSNVIFEKLVDALNYTSQSARADILKQVLPFIHGEKATTLLSVLLKDIATNDLLDAAIGLWGGKKIRSEKIGNELCQAAIRIGATEDLREILLSIDNDYETLKCIEKLLNLSKEDLRWILGCENLGSGKGMLLANIINQASNSELIGLELACLEVDDVISVLAKDIERYQSALIKILLCSRNVSCVHIQIGISLFERISDEKDKSAFGSFLLRESLRIDDKNIGELAGTVVGLIARSSAFQSIIFIAFDRRDGCAEFSRFLEYLNDCAKQFYMGLDDHIYALVNLITNSKKIELLEIGSKALAELIARSQDKDSNNFEEICLKILGYSLNNFHLPVSALIVESFPPIYKKLKKGGWFHEASLFNFSDWDKCKILRKFLVHTFLSASWPPIDFAVCASRTGDMIKIFKLLVKTSGNDNYLLLIRDEVMSLHGEENIAIRHAIDEIIYDWK